MRGGRFRPRTRVATFQVRPDPYLPAVAVLSPIMDVSRSVPARGLARGLAATAVAHGVRVSVAVVTGQAAYARIPMPIGRPSRLSFFAAPVPLMPIRSAS